MDQLVSVRNFYRTFKNPIFAEYFFEYISGFEHIFPSKLSVTSSSTRSIVSAIFYVIFYPKSFSKFEEDSSNKDNLKGGTTA
jgi:hypothetical protein